MRSASERIQSIDLLRGAIMIIMALDHVRDFVHRAAFAGSPTNLATTTAAIFFTRWITHFCAPVFMFTAGLGAYLLSRKRSVAEVSRFLWTRGLWLMVLDWTAVHAALSFNLNYAIDVVNVLWALGLSMVVLAALVRLPVRVLSVVCLATVALHNLLDKIQAKDFGAAAPLWNVLHQLGAFQLGAHTIVIAYPLVPWFAVMGAGFCCGRWFTWEAPARQRALVRLGAALTVAFLVVRWLNVYGDPARWSAQKTGLFTLLSFLNTTKYPPSLDFLLMTMGPAVIVLGLIDRVRLGDANPLLVFGRTPLFYFLGHLVIAHMAAAVLSYVQLGNASMMFNPGPSLGGKPFPPAFGLELGGTYAMWIAVVALMYPLCRWFAGVKQRRKDWWLSYL